MKIITKIGNMFHRSGSKKKWVRSVDCHYDSDDYMFGGEYPITWEEAECQEFEVMETDESDEFESDYANKVIEYHGERIRHELMVKNKDPDQDEVLNSVFADSIDDEPNSVANEKSTSKMKLSMKSMIKKLFTKKPKVEPESTAPTLPERPTKSVGSNVAVVGEKKKSGSKERVSSSTGTSNPFDDCFQIVDSTTTLESKIDIDSMVSEFEERQIRAVNVKNFKKICNDDSIRTWEVTGLLPTVETPFN